MSIPIVDVDADTAPSGELVVVGIGASAGGIRACREFLPHAPPDSGMAYVVILHLSPDHESQLAEVLQHATAMPVTQVTEPRHGRARPRLRDPAEQEPGDGRRRSLDALARSQRIEERRAPVDIFFRTLAESRRIARGVRRAVGHRRRTARAGLKRDQGARRPRRSRRIPSEAEYDDMPRNAIATGLVDRAAGRGDAGADHRLAAMRRGRATAARGADCRAATATAEALRDILTQLRAAHRPRLLELQAATLLRRIERRIDAAPDCDACRVRARSSASTRTSRRRCCATCSISVTNFFRDAEAFETLEQRVIPPLFERQGDGRSGARLGAGCATGEEAYSMAMLLAERGGGVRRPAGACRCSPPTSTSRRSRWRARGSTREARSPTCRRSGCAASSRRRRRLPRAPRAAGDGAVRAPQRHQGPAVLAPRSGLAAATSSSTSTPAQERVIEMFHFALKPGGYLFLGTSESADGASDLFLTVDKDAHIYQSRARRAAGVAAAASPGVPRRSSRRARSTAAARDRMRPSGSRTPDLHQRLLEQYAPPSLVVNEEHHIVHLSERAGRLPADRAAASRRATCCGWSGPSCALELRTALYQAAQKRTSVEARGIAAATAIGIELVNLLVRPVLARRRSGARLLPRALRGRVDAAGRPRRPSTAAVQPRRARRAPARGRVVRVKAQLRATIEQYETQPRR